MRGGGKRGGATATGTSSIQVGKCGKSRGRNPSKVTANGGVGFITGGAALYRSWVG